MLKIGDKIVWWTDIHVGLRGNEKRHNEECVEFVKWMIEEAKEFGADTSIFGGDFMHVRSNISPNTLHYAIKIFDLVDANFKKHYQIVGNHDLYFKDKRDVNSVEYIKNYKNIEIVNKITKVGDVVLTPWLVGNEHKKIVKHTEPYIFGHFEFPLFLMNAVVSMPDHGHIHPDYFTTKDQVITSGHFHIRQQKFNKHGALINYSGNCFPHNFSDAWDDERGIMLLELGKPPVFKKWPNAPKFRTMNLSELIENPENYIDPFTCSRVTIDIDITYEEANFIKDALITQYGSRDLKLIPNKSSAVDIEVDSSGIKYETVDQIVVESLKAIESQTLDKNLLIDIYRNI